MAKGSSPGGGQRWSGARRTTSTYSHKQHLADVMRDAQRISEESRQNTLRHIERMQEHLDRTATITFGETPKIKPKTAPRTPADIQLDTPVSIVEVTDAHTGKVTSRYKGGRRIPDDGSDKPYTPPGPHRPVAEVGKPCPEHIALSQGLDRCLFGGRALDDLLCSRKTGHDGNHIATAGDVPGAEVLAVCAE